MKKLDRYIIGKYFMTFFFVVLIFTLIASAIDFSEKVENFIKEPCTKSEILFDYYAGWIPYINGLLFPLYALISVIFFTSRMAFNSEVISILNAGVSFMRFLRPYLIGASIIACGHLIANHFFIPSGNESRLNFERKYIWKNQDKGKVKDIHMFIGDQQKVYIRYYNKSDSAAHDLRLEQLDENGLLTKFIDAKIARWHEEKKSWNLKNYEIRTFDGLKETFVAHPNKSLDTTINLAPADFVRFLNAKEMLLSKDLRSFIEAERGRGMSNTRIYEIELYRRTSDPISIIILTIIGVAIAARKVRGGLGLHLAIGIGLGAIFIFLSKFSVTFATNTSFPTILGVWVPNIIFGLIAVFLVFRAQK